MGSGLKPWMRLIYPISKALTLWGSGLLSMLAARKLKDIDITNVRIHRAIGWISGRMRSNFKLILLSPSTLLVITNWIPVTATRLITYNTMNSTGQLTLSCIQTARWLAKITGIFRASERMKITLARTARPFVKMKCLLKRAFFLSMHDLSYVITDS